MDLKDYRKKAKELGGNIRVKTWKDPFKGNLYKFVGVVTPGGVNLGNGNVWGKEFMEAAEHCRFGLEQNPVNAHLWNTLGVIFFNQEEYPTAAESFERAVSINPYYYDALYNLRDTYSELGNKAGEAVCEERLSKLKEPKEDL